MKNILTTGSLAVAALATAGMLAWQAPAAFADHGADDSTQSSGSHRHGHGNDDGPNHDANDDHGRHGHHGHHDHSNDDGQNHDAHDDHGGHHGGCDD